MKFIEILKVIFLGLVEGITEWLPISSTGHMILVDEFIKLKVSENFMEMFLFVIQLGAIIAVIVLYFNKLNPFSSKKNKEEKEYTWNMWFKIIVACIPAGVIGLLFDDFFDKYFYNYVVVAIMLILYGILFIIIENKTNKKTYKINNLNELTYKKAFQIGLFQVLSIIPGTSRSGSTILGAMIIGTKRDVAAEFTFFLAIPVMLGVSFLKILKFGLNFTTNELIILILGMVVAFITSIFTIKFLVNYVKKHDFKIFGYYRIALGTIVLLYFLIF